MPDIDLDIVIEDRRWRRIARLAPRLRAAAAETYRHLPVKLRHPFAVTLLLAGDAKVRRLNRDFRCIDKPTNVLSFPQFVKGKLAKSARSGPKIEAGDIVFGYQYIVTEAKKDRKILINHLDHLLIHGILHILGYDHLSDAEADRMERLETRIMAALGLPDPYAPQPVEPKAR